MENRQGEGKNSIGNVEAKELICMTHRHELLWEGGGVQDGVESGGGEWDNCNSIINKIYFLKNPKGSLKKKKAMTGVSRLTFSRSRTAHPMHCHTRRRSVRALNLWPLGSALCSCKRVFTTCWTWAN